jgi:hypothetical protein
MGSGILNFRNPFIKQKEEYPAGFCGPGKGGGIKEAVLKPASLIKRDGLWITASAEILTV